MCTAGTGRRSAMSVLTAPAPCCSCAGTRVSTASSSRPAWAPRSGSPAPTDSACRSSPLPLAPRAEERRAVHEGGPLDRRRAARAGQALPAVGVEPAREVARLAVDVDVERVEAGPARRDRLPQDGLDLGQQPLCRQPGELIAGPVAVNTRAP